MRVSEILTEAAQAESFLNARVAVKFELEGTTEQKWWLGTVNRESAKHLFVTFDNPKIDAKEYICEFEITNFTKPKAKDKKHFALVQLETKKNTKGLSDAEIEKIKVEYVKPTKAPKTQTAKKEVAVPADGDKFKITPRMWSELQSYAEDGDRIVVDGKTIFKGFGNRSGLHSYLATALSEVFTKSWPNTKKKLELGNFSKIEIHTFRNIDRDRGRWVVERTYTKE